MHVAGMFRDFVKLTTASVTYFGQADELSTGINTVIKCGLSCNSIIMS